MREVVTAFYEACIEAWTSYKAFVRQCICWYYVMRNRRLVVILRFVYKKKSYGDSAFNTLMNQVNILKRIFNRPCSIQTFLPILVELCKSIGSNTVVFSIKQVGLFLKSVYKKFKK
jgi:hypothetical protein